MQDTSAVSGGSFSFFSLNSSRQISGTMRRSRRPFVLVTTLALALSGVTAVNAALPTRVPDFYAEPGRNPFREPVQTHGTENIDPFSGNLNLSYVDLLVPGNGGFDIKIRRHYNSNRVYVPDFSLPQNLVQAFRSPFGTGWTMHFGRVLKTHNQETNMPVGCEDPWVNGENNQLNDAVLEKPEGGTATLFPNATSFATSNELVTKDNWVAYCRPNGAGFDVYSSDGTKYEMTEHRQGDVEGAPSLVMQYHAWYPSRIIDRNGNYITITYRPVGTVSTGKEALPDTIRGFHPNNTADGRVVTFSYAGTGSGNTIRIASVISNNQTVNYTLALQPGSTTHYHLTQVQLPVTGTSWNYAYYNRTSSQAGDELLQRVTHPYGATVTYDYDWECFNDPCSGAPQSHVVSSKVHGGNDVAAGTWTFNYSPSTTEDVTTVTFPGGRYVYRHYGSQMAAFSGDLPQRNLWKIGLLRSKEIYTGTALTRRETYTWTSDYLISNEQYFHPYYDGSNGSPQTRDAAVWAPVLTQKVIEQDGTAYTTTYSNFDASFNPRTIVESGQPGQPARTTTLIYFPRVTPQNIASLVEDETVLFAGEPSKTINRTFDANANLRSINKYGLTESYTHHATGDVRTRQNGRPGVEWTYLNYKRGIPQEEQHPEGVVITRTVNDTGTIQSETISGAGRSRTTGYSYDGLNRITEVRTARTDDANITVAWNAGNRTRTVSRAGLYSQVTTFDGFGRVSFLNTNGVTKDINYNALGHKSFESYLSSTLGDTYTTDVLGRVRSIIHGGSPGGSRIIDYLSGNRMRTIVNRGDDSVQTTHTYRSYGDPSTEQVLMAINAAEGRTENVLTAFQRNVLGQVTSANQGGVQRTYAYYPDTNLLQSIDNPETGVTTFDLYDEAGNMRSRRVNGSAATEFVYDGLNRMTAINYPGTTPDVSYGYDGNNNLLTASNTASSRVYDYDDNNNLRYEALNVSGRTFETTYSHNALDYLQSIRYPSSEIVSLNPDALGRPQSVGNYASGISYHPTGTPRQFQYSNSRLNYLELNQRQWVNRIIHAADLQYDYDGVGNVRNIWSGSTLDRALSYDGLDRLQTASGPWGSGSFQYDAVGNIRRQILGSFDLTYSYDPRNRLSAISGSKPYSFGYDLYGNVTSNSYHNFVYDDASNLITVSGASAATYTYDANHMRVRMQQAGKDTYVFYAKNGDLLGEYDADGRYREYFYLGGKLLAVRGVSPNNQSPVANAGPDQSVNERSPTAVMLSAAASTDPDGSIARYVWRQVTGPAVALTNANTATASFLAPRVSADTTLTFRLLVDDGDNGTSTDTVNVVVRNVGLDDDTDGLPDTWEEQYFGNLSFGPNDDPDGDGLTNQQEYQRGTNPMVREPTPDPVIGVKAAGGIYGNSISWAISARATRYNVYWSTSPGVTKTNGNKVAGLNSPNFSHTRLTNGTRYYYMVTAENSSGESADSAEVSAVPSIAPLIPILELILED